MLVERVRDFSKMITTLFCECRLYGYVMCISWSRGGVFNGRTFPQKRGSSIQPHPKPATWPRCYYITCCNVLSRLVAVNAFLKIIIDWPTLQKICDAKAELSRVIRTFNVGFVLALLGLCCRGNGCRWCFVACAVSLYSSSELNWTQTMRRLVFKLRLCKVKVPFRCRW